MSRSIRKRDVRLNARTLVVRGLQIHTENFEEIEPSNRDIFVDGATPGNGSNKAIAGAAAYVPSENLAYIKKVSGEQTNNRAELTAIYLALKRSTGPVRIFSDSGVMLCNVLEINKAKANLDLMEKIWRVLRKNVVFVWVPGHQKDDKYISIGNNKADEFANKIVNMIRAE